MAEPLVSVIMPAYNSERFIEQAAYSVVTQTFTDWELIVVDDGSTDKTLDLISDLSAREPRVRYLACSERRGVAGARNVGIESARGEIIAFLDSDDFWAPEKLRSQTAHLKETGHSLTYGPYRRIDEEGRHLGTVRPPAALDYKLLLRSNFIGALTAVYRRAAFPHLRFESVGNEDYLFWLRALAETDAFVTVTPSAAPLAYYRVRTSSTSSNKLKSAYWQWQIYRTKLNLPLTESTFCLLSYALHGAVKRMK